MHCFLYNEILFCEAGTYTTSVVLHCGLKITLHTLVLYTPHFWYLGSNHGASETSAHSAGVQSTRRQKMLSSTLLHCYHKKTLWSGFSLKSSFFLFHLTQISMVLSLKKYEKPVRIKMYAVPVAL